MQLMFHPLMTILLSQTKFWASPCSKIELWGTRFLSHFHTCSNQVDHQYLLFWLGRALIFGWCKILSQDVPRKSQDGNPKMNIIETKLRWWMDIYIYTYTHNTYKYTYIYTYMYICRLYIFIDYIFTDYIYIISIYDVLIWYVPIC